MNDNEILDLWQIHDKKLEKVLKLNKEIVCNMRMEKLNDTIGTLRGPKKIMLLIGIPYTLLLYILTFIGFKADGIFVTIGFGAISILMSTVIVSYMYHMYLITQISKAQEVIEVQLKISELRIASFNTVKLAILQLPFWSICWMSMNALNESPVLYGGVNLIVFLCLSFVSCWIYQKIDIEETDSSNINRFFFSGSEWDPIIKASKILKEIKEYQ